MFQKEMSLLFFRPDGKIHMIIVSIPAKLLILAKEALQMECKMEKQVLVSTSMCDNTGKLAIPHIFSLFMDLASEHGAAIGLGMDVLAKKGLFWLTVKTKVRIYSRPDLLRSLTAATWPEVPGKIRCNRHYELTDGETVIADGKTEWTMLEVSTGKLARVADTYPQDIQHYERIACDGPYAKVSDDFSACPEIAVYTVRSTDIDLGQHMNNAAYVHAIFGAFSCQELAEMPIREMDVLFRAPCFEGDRLSIRRRDTGEGPEIGILREDGKTAVAAKIFCR